MYDEDQKNGGPTAGPPTENTPVPDEEGRRPTPVRTVMESGDEGEKDEPEIIRVIRDEETGSDWIVSVSGWSAGGILPLRSVPLLELTFAKSEQPEIPLCRAYSYGETLEAIPDHDLLSTLRNSEPFREPTREPKETGRGGKRNKRGNRNRS